MGQAASRARPWCRSPLLVASLAVAITGGVWLGLPDLAPEGRIALIAFGLAIVGWVLTDLDDTAVAAAAAGLLVVSGVGSPGGVLGVAADPTMWLLLGAFIVAGAVTRCGLSDLLTLAVVSRARSVGGLFYLLTGVLLLGAFLIPATSGRAALMIPIFTRSRIPGATALGVQRS